MCSHVSTTASGGTSLAGPSESGSPQVGVYKDAAPSESAVGSEASSEFREAEVEVSSGDAPGAGPRGCLPETIRIVTDCSGIEAPIQALENPGVKFRHVILSDKDENSRQMIRANFADSGHQLCEDITKRDHTTFT